MIIPTAYAVRTFKIMIIVLLTKAGLVIQLIS